MTDKKLTRCKVCGDIHFGREAPEICPTCKARNAYFPVDREDARKQMAF